MKCPHCSADSLVLSTRTKPGQSVRRRECFNGHRFTTYEVTSGALDRRALRTAVTGIKKRATAWQRRQAILRSTESATQVAAKLGVSEARVRQVRSRYTPAQPHDTDGTAPPSR